MRIVIKTIRPRNPLVALALMRRAGSHRAGGRTARQHGRRALQRELNLLRHSP